MYRCTTLQADGHRTRVRLIRAGTDKMTLSVKRWFRWLMSLAGATVVFLLVTVHMNHDNRPLNSEPAFRSWEVLMQNKHNSLLNDRAFGRDIDEKPGQPDFQGHSDDQGLRGRACDEECTRFRKYFNDWPPDKPKAAIVLLTKVTRLTQFTDLLGSLDKFFNNHFGYPVVVFHEQEYTRKRGEVRQLTESEVFFQEIKFAIPDFLVDPVRVNIPCTSSIAYRHMCRFYAKGLFEEPVMQELEYYWRLDDDSLLLNHVTYDVFKYMRTNKLSYGYVWRHLDAYDCIAGLWEATRDYIATNDIKTYSFSSWKRPWLYYNNFEISELAPWRSREYRNYINYIDRLGGIYYHRWGDAPIRGIAVSMFIPTDRVHHFKYIPYSHGSLVQNRSETEPSKLETLL